MVVTKKSHANLPLRTSGGFPAPAARPGAREASSHRAHHSGAGLQLSDTACPPIAALSLCPSKASFASLHQPMQKTEKNMKENKLIRKMGVLHQFQLRVLDQCRMPPVLLQEQPSHYRQLLINCLHQRSGSSELSIEHNTEHPGSLLGPMGRWQRDPPGAPTGAHPPGAGTPLPPASPQGGERYHQLCPDFARLLFFPR